MMLLATGTVSAGRALMNTLMGMGTVFLVLIFISYIISLFGYINKFAAKKQVQEPTFVVKAPVEPEPEPEPEEAEEELTDDTELVAVITAAIAAYAGTSSEGFQVRSIKRAAKSTWK